MLTVAEEDKGGTYKDHVNVIVRKMGNDMFKISIVVAITENGVIGRDGRMPWRLPSDLKYFRRLTMGKPLIMGRKTFASLPKPLDWRDNIVVTRDTQFTGEGAIIMHSLEEAMRLAHKCAELRGTNEIMIIGGAEVYREAFDLANRIYLTRIHTFLKGDATFPLVDLNVWQKTNCEIGKRTKNDEYDFTYFIFNKKG